MCKFNFDDNFKDAIEKCMYFFKLEDELLWRNVTILNDDLQIIWSGVITEKNMEEKINLIVNGCKYYIKGEDK